MQLPFTREQFLDVFGQYNDALWPEAILLWIASAAVAFVWFRNGSVDGRLAAALLSVEWAWAGAAYHLVWFTSINRAAYLFGSLFLLQAMLLAWFGIHRRTLRFDRSGKGWRGVAAFLIIYSLAYPALVLASGFRYPRMPTFGVPCPTTLLTAGLLLAATPEAPIVLFAIPVLWCAVAGSAAQLFGVHADLALFMAGGLLLLRAGVAVATRRVRTA